MQKWKLGGQRRATEVDGVKTSICAKRIGPQPNRLCHSLLTLTGQNDDQRHAALIAEQLKRWKSIANA
jgi:hypothetical protein